MKRVDNIKICRREEAGVVGAGWVKERHGDVSCILTYAHTNTRRAYHIETFSIYIRKSATNCHRHAHKKRRNLSDSIVKCRFRIVFVD